MLSTEIAARTRTQKVSSALRFMHSPRTPPAAHAALCKVEVRKQRDFWGFSPANCMLRSQLTVKRTRAHAVPTPQRIISAGCAGSRSGLRCTGARSVPAKVAHPMGPSITWASAWSPAAFALAPPRPVPPSGRLSAISAEFSGNFFCFIFPA
jgi:hypothetical protein